MSVISKEGKKQTIIERFILMIISKADYQH